MSGCELRLGYHPSLIRCCWAQTASHNQVQENLQNYLSGNSLRHEISFFVHNESCYCDNINMIDEILKYNLFLESLCFKTIFENIVSFQNLLCPKGIPWSPPLCTSMHLSCILTLTVLICMEGWGAGVAWRSAMHYELRLGEIQSLNNVSHVTDTRETGPLPGYPPH